MSDGELRKAQEQRRDALLFESVDKSIEALFSAEDVGYQAKSKLRKLIAHYAKQDDPYRSCVREQLKRFGPGKTETVCGDLKEIILTVEERKSREAGVHYSNVELDGETKALLLSISDEDLEGLVMEAQNV